MTKEQFALWLIGYITVNKIDSADIESDDALAVGTDVLEAAWSVPHDKPATAAAEQTHKVPPAKRVTSPAPGTTGQLNTPRVPQPGDLDYPDSENTSKAEGT